MILLARSPAFKARLSRFLALAPALGMSTQDESARTLRGAVESAARVTSRDDMLACLLLLRLLPVAAKWPQARWLSEARKVTEESARYFRSDFEAFASSIPERLVDYSGMTRDELAYELTSLYHLEVIEDLAGAMGRSMHDAFRLEGESHLRDAIDQGRGAILWCESALTASRRIKAAIAGAGYAVHHLSRPTHNLSNTSVGIRFLNLVVRNAEAPYLAERILLTRASQMSAMRHMSDLLARNQVVSITVGSTGSQTVESPFFDNVSRIATGAPHLALRTGAPLLPVFVCWDETDYTVRIEQPIRLTGMERQAAYQHAADEYARRLDAHLRRCALPWSGYIYGPYVAPGD